MPPPVGWCTVLTSAITANCFLVVIINRSNRYHTDQRTTLPLHLSLPLSNHIPNPKQQGWLGSQVVSVLDSGAEGPGFKSQPRRCRVTVLGKLFTPIVRHCAAKLVAALLRVAGVTAGLAESNGSLPPGLWLTPPEGWLPRTVISSGTLRSVIKYGLHSPF